MRQIYQYMSFERGRFILHNQALPLSHFSHYNDPFEGIIENNTYEQYREAFQKNDKAEIDKLIRSAVENIQKRERVTARDKQISDALSDITSSTIVPFPLWTIYAIGKAAVKLLSSDNNIADSMEEKVIEKYIEKLFEKMTNTYSSCFSKNNNSVLMWSHYANSHKGIVIAFNADSKPFKDNTLIDIHYTDKPFALDSENMNVEGDCRSAGQQA